MLLSSIAGTKMKLSNNSLLLGKQNCDLQACKAWLYSESQSKYSSIRQYSTFTANCETLEGRAGEEGQGTESLLHWICSACLQLMVCCWHFQIRFQKITSSIKGKFLLQHKCWCVAGNSNDSTSDKAGYILLWDYGTKNWFRQVKSGNAWRN